jgi:hypothetical protein
VLCWLNFCFCVELADANVRHAWAVVELSTMSQSCCASFEASNRRRLKRSLEMLSNSRLV